MSSSQRCPEFQGSPWAPALTSGPKILPRRFSMCPIPRAHLYAASASLLLVFSFVCVFLDCWVFSHYPFPQVVTSSFQDQGPQASRGSTFSLSKTTPYGSCLLRMWTKPSVQVPPVYNCKREGSLPVPIPVLHSSFIAAVTSLYV